MSTPLKISWSPSEATIANSNIGQMMAEKNFDSFQAFHRWSVSDPSAFWGETIEHLDIGYRSRPDKIFDPTDSAETVRWLPGAELNIIESCFKRDAFAPAVLSAVEGVEGVRVTTYGELEKLVNQVASGFRNAGHKPGDR